MLQLALPLQYWPIMEREGEKQHTAYRVGLIDEIARTMQTLRQDPVPSPGEAFYLDRLEAYVQTLADLDRTGE